MIHQKYIEYGRIITHITRQYYAYVIVGNDINAIMSQNIMNSRHAKFV